MKPFYSGLVAFGLSSLAMRLIHTPILLWESAPVGNDAPTSEHDFLPTDPGFPVAKNPTPGEPIVFPVEKSQGGSNPFVMGITIGRVETNDIIIADSSVSRFHAWLQYDDRTVTWLLADAESKNGTWADGLKLEPNARARLNDGSLVRLGDVSMRFLLPAGVKALIEKLTNDQPTR